MIWNKIVRRNNVCTHTFWLRQILLPTSPSHDLTDSRWLSLLSVQILFVSGLSFVIGLERTFRFFFQRHKVKATSFFLGGVFVVLIGWPIIGVVLEIYGFFLLFRSVQTERKPPRYHRYPELIWVSWSRLVLSLQQRVLPGGGRLHQTCTCARVFAQLTRDQHSKYIMMINESEINHPLNSIETVFSVPFMSFWFLFLLKAATTSDIWQSDPKKHGIYKLFMTN